MLLIQTNNLLIFNLHVQDCPEVIKKQLELSIDGVNVKNDQTLGSITVSAIFRPVEAVARSELDVQRSVLDTDIQGSVGVATADSGVRADVKSIVKESGRYIGRHMSPLASRVRVLLAAVILNALACLQSLQCMIV